VLKTHPIIYLIDGNKRVEMNKELISVEDFFNSLCKSVMVSVYFSYQ